MRVVNLSDFSPDLIEEKDVELVYMSHNITTKPEFKIITEEPLIENQAHRWLRWYMCEQIKYLIHLGRFIEIIPSNDANYIHLELFIAIEEKNNKNFPFYAAGKFKNK